MHITFKSTLFIADMLEDLSESKRTNHSLEESAQIKSNLWTVDNFLNSSKADKQLSTPIQPSFLSSRESLLGIELVHSLLPVRNAVKI